MDQTPDAFAAALASGDTDRVNRAINEIEHLDLQERAALFEDCFERCRELYESSDGYQRQSVVRFAAALYPRLTSEQSAPNSLMRHYREIGHSRKSKPTAAGFANFT